MGDRGWGMGNRKKKAAHCSLITGFDILTAVNGR